MKQIFLTSGTSWTVPADWNPLNNSVELIGGGGCSAAMVNVQAYTYGGAGAQGLIVITYTPLSNNISPQFLGFAFI